MSRASPARKDDHQVAASPSRSKVNFSRPRPQSRCQDTAETDEDYQDWVDGIHTRMAFIETVIRDLQNGLPPPIPHRNRTDSPSTSARRRSLRKTKPVACLRELRAQHSEDSLRSASCWSPGSSSDSSSGDSRTSYTPTRDSWSTTLWPRLEEDEHGGAFNKEADELSRWIIESLLGCAGPNVVET